MRRSSLPILLLDDRSVEKWTIKHFHCKMVYPGRSLAGTDAYESSRRARNRTRLQGWFQANDHLVGRKRQVGDLPHWFFSLSPRPTLRSSAGYGTPNFRRGEWHLCCRL